MIFGWKDRVGVSGRCRRMAIVVVAAGMVAVDDATMRQEEEESVEDSGMPFLS
jgi:hypothetical protein